MQVPFFTFVRRCAFRLCFTGCGSISLPLLLFCSLTPGFCFVTFFLFLIGFFLSLGQGFTDADSLDPVLVLNDLEFLAFSQDKPRGSR